MYCPVQLNQHQLYLIMELPQQQKKQHSRKLKGAI
tara:strand:- start:224 stop:328 length:105 start_codon:yes stop_codon:yes gene_type:complete